LERVGLERPAIPELKPMTIIYPVMQADEAERAALRPIGCTMISTYGRTSIVAKGRQKVENDDYSCSVRWRKCGRICWRNGVHFRWNTSR
jgi:hypothetical protein